MYLVTTSSADFFWYACRFSIDEEQQTQNQRKQTVKPQHSRHSTSVLSLTTDEIITALLFIPLLRDDVLRLRRREEFAVTDRLVACIQIRKLSIEFDTFQLLSVLHVHSGR